MGVVYEIRFHAGDVISGDPVVEHLGALVTELAQEFVGAFVEVEQWDFFFCRDLAGGDDVIAMGIHELAVRIEFPAGNRGAEQGMGAARFGFLDIYHKIGFETAERFGETIGVRFVVVVAELDDDPVAGLEFIADRLPTAFADEALAAAAIHGVILDAHAGLKIEREELSPTAFGIGGNERLVGHGGIADHVNGANSGGLGGRMCGVVEAGWGVGFDGSISGICGIGFGGDRFLWGRRCGVKRGQ